MGKIECPTCGFKIAADADLHKGCPKCASPVASAAAHRAPGEASTSKASASSAGESASGACKKANGGPHQWKFGKCSLCGKGEGQVGPTHKAKAKKLHAAPDQDGPLSGVATGSTEELSRKISGRWHESDNYDETGEPTPHAKIKAAQGGRTGKVECPTCGFKIAPSADLKKGCPKCGSTVRAPVSAPALSHQAGDLPAHAPKASSAGESASGACKKANGGPHQWKFGKCSLCGVGEGQFKAAGTVVNPGAHDACPKDGGKHTYKFSKCSKCGQSEMHK